MNDQQRMTQAFVIASRAHAGQVRKGSNTPYIAHPMAVCAIAIEYGADEDQAIAALLHDSVEDGGAEYIGVIRSEFGVRVLAIVEGCTDGVPNSEGVKAPWQERKQAYLEHLRNAPDEVLLVSGSDKLHNARAIVNDLEVVGTAVYERFSSSMADTLWYYRSLSDIFTVRKAPMASALARVVARMSELSNSPIAARAH